MTLFDAIKAKYPNADILKDEPMAKHTTFRVGGSADVVFFPENEEMLAFAVKAAAERGEPCAFIGNGSNVLVKDGGLRGLTVIFSEQFSGAVIEGETVTVRAGEPLSRLSRKAESAGLAGLEFACGIPGTLGGAMTMNAGAYGEDMAGVCESARLFNPKDGSIKEYTRAEMRMGYRTTLAMTAGLIVTGATLRLRHGDKAAIRRKMEDLNARRREKQPLSYPSAGSTFKRPTGHFAGALIEQAGLKGAKIGGAEVSTLHAGFLINTGNATAKDVLDLIEYVKARVFDDSGVALEPEVRIMGE